MQPTPSRPRGFIFADEAGCFTFSRGPNISRYFIVCTLLTGNCDKLSAGLINLRRELIWQRAPVRDYFHATADKQVVRDAVFDFLKDRKFTIRATILEKSKAMPKLRVTEERFYQYAWHYHLKNSLGGIEREIQLTTASLGTAKKRGAFESAVHDALGQNFDREKWFTAFCPASADPCLQAVDYCTWALQRKWERGDTRSFDLIKDKISDQFDLFRIGKTHYY